MDYIELAVGRFANRGHLYNVQQITPHFVRSNFGRTMWRSYFVFGEPLQEFLATHKALNTAYSQPIGIDRMRLDFEVEGDDGSQLELTRSQVAEFVLHLIEHMDVPEEWIQPWFSGMKGFHIDLPNLFGLEPNPNLPAQLLASIKDLIFHPLMDTKPINPAGLIRMDWSRHSGTGLFKVPLTIEELCEYSADDIRHIAVDPRETRKGFELATFEDLEPIWQRYALQPKQSGARALAFGKGSIKLEHDPTRIVTCMQKLMMRGPASGRRHTDMLRLASWLWRGGVPLAVALPALLSWVEPTFGQHSDKSREDEIAEFTHHISSVYEKRKYLYTCQDHVMKEFCDPSCIFHQKKDYTVDMSTSESMMRGFREFVKKVEIDKQGFDLRDIYPHCPSYRVVPGEVMMVTGDTGMGKSAWVQNLVVRLKKRTAYLNLEMAETLTYRRFLQIAHGLSQFEVMQAFHRDNPEELHDLNAAIDHIEVKSIAPTIQQVEQIITTRTPSIVVIDTTDAINVPEAGNSEMFALKKVVDEMRRMAQMHQIIMIGIHHINKTASKEGNIDLNALTGHRAAVTKMDHVIGILGVRQSKERTIKTLKARDSSPIALPLIFNPFTMRFTPPTVIDNAY